MAEAVGKEPINNGQDIEYTTFAQIPLPNHNTSYGQAQNQWGRYVDSFP